jgi:hypothetical protein
MSLPSRDYYLLLRYNGEEKFLAIKHGQITWVNGLSLVGAFNFHSHDQAEEFIQFLKVNHYQSANAINLEVYRY